MREELTYEATNCLGGINEQAESATMDQCADALNLWVKNGRVEQRPGFVGVSSVVNGSSTPFLTNPVLISETSGGVFTTASIGQTLTLSGFAAGGRWYVGGDSIDVDDLNGLGVRISTSNGNAIYHKAEYWNGESWQFLLVHEIGTDGARAWPHLSYAPGTSNSYFYFAPPADWTATTVNGSTKHFIRFTLEDAGGTTLDASTSISNVNPGDVGSIGILDFFRGLFVIKFPSSRRYLAIATSVSSNRTRYFSLSTLAYDAAAVYVRNSDIVAGAATVAVVPEFDEAFVSYTNYITRHTPNPTNGAFAMDSVQARVEADPSLVGPGAKYSTDFIAQEGAFPAASLITFFKGQLWAAGIEGQPNKIQWSAPSPAHRVWPLISHEQIAENDNSNITAIYGFGENMLVWKNDSMWQMVFTGTNAFDLAEFAPVRVPGGVGCVAQGSIVEIQGRVYWLAEDGVYSFDGVTVRPVYIERIQSVFRRINPSRRSFAVATDWPGYKTYLLAIAVDGSDTNNLVLAYQYENPKRPRWWIWDGINAQFWMLDEDTADNDVLYFGDSLGRIYEFGKGKTDHGAAIESYATTQRMARAARGYTKTARTVSVESNNQARALDVSVIPDDSASLETVSARSYTDPYEVEYGEATATSVYVPDRRRTRRADFRSNCRHFQVKVAHTTKNAAFALGSITAGYLIGGMRR